MEGRRREFAIVLSAAIVVSCTVSLVRHFSAAWSEIESIDLIVYWSGLRLFFSPANPYDPQAMLAEQQRISLHSSGLMAWNPPILFVMLAPLLSLPIGLIRLGWTFITTICSVLGAYLSARLVSREPLKFPIWILYAVFFCPFLYEISIGQISSLLNLLFVMSFVLFKSGRFAASGMLAGMLLVKPHMFYLMLLWFFLVSLLEKRWRFLLGFFLAILGGTGVAEILHPGINIQWLMRESWPIQYVGSTLPLLVRAAILAYCGISSYLPQVLIPAIAALGIAVALLVAKCSADREKIMFYAIILTPLSAPYGFVFDQVVLIVPMIAIISCIHEAPFPLHLRRLVLLGLILFQAGILSLSKVPLFGVPLSWYPMPLILLLIWWGLARYRRALDLTFVPDAGFERLD